MPSKRKKNKRRMRRVQAQRRALEEQYASCGKGTPGVSAVSAPVTTQVPLPKASKCPPPFPTEMPMAVVAAEDLPEASVEPPVEEPALIEEAESITVPVTEDAYAKHEPEMVPVDAAGHTEAVVKAAGPTEAVLEAAGPTEAVDEAAGPTKSVVEATEPIEAAVKAAGPTEAVVKAAGPTEAVVESAGPIESVVKAAGPTEAVVEAAGPTESVVKAAEPTEAVVEATEPTEAVVEAAGPTESVVKATEPIEAVVKAAEPTEAVVKAAEPTEAVEPEPGPEHQADRLKELMPLIESTSDPGAEGFVVTETALAVKAAIPEQQIPGTTAEAPEVLSKTLTETIPALEPVLVPKETIHAQDEFMAKETEAKKDLAGEGSPTVDAISECLVGAKVAIEG